jgi:protein-L-isoaspartate(D-aspartate) O-methyltransferase
MTDLLDVRPGHRVLEVGTGCGYQAAVLAELGALVDTLEIVHELVLAARRILAELGYATVRVHERDGHAGLPERAPFDRIIVTASPARVPKALIDQLAPGGRLVIPVGERHHQELRLIEKDVVGEVHERRTLPVAFVPLTGGAPGGNG